MLAGILTALLMLGTFLAEETVLSTLPLPWRILPAAMILSLALMHRVSFELGAAFIFTSALAAYASGLAPISSLAVTILTIAAAYGLSTRIFASRSLIAFTGFAFATGLIYLFLRFAVFSPVVGFFPWMYLFSAAMSALLSLVATIGLNWVMSGFGRSFVTKADTYEIRAERT